MRSLTQIAVRPLRVKDGKLLLEFHALSAHQRYLVLCVVMATSYDKKGSHTYSDNHNTGFAKRAHFTRGECSSKTLDTKTE